MHSRLPGPLLRCIGKPILGQDNLSCLPEHARKGASSMEVYTFGALAQGHGISAWTIGPWPHIFTRQFPDMTPTFTPCDTPAPRRASGAAAAWRCRRRRSGNAASQDDECLSRRRVGGGREGVQEAGRVLLPVSSRAASSRAAWASMAAFAPAGSGPRRRVLVARLSGGRGASCPKNRQSFSCPWLLPRRAAWLGRPSTLPRQAPRVLASPSGQPPR